MVQLACALILALAWLAMAAYMNYKIWWRPDDIWRVQQAEQQQLRGGPYVFQRFLHLDPLGLGKSRGRFIWFERAVAVLILLIGIGMLVAVAGALLGY